MKFNFYSTSKIYIFLSIIKGGMNQYKDAPKPIWLVSFYLVKLKPAKLAIIRIPAKSHRMGYLEIFCLSGVVLGPIDVPKSKKFKKRVRTIC